MDIIKDESKIVKMLGGGVKIKILIMAVLLGVCCFITYYFHVIFETGTLFSHFFYIPIILAILWWGRKGLVVAIFLAALLVFSHFFIRISIETFNDLIRALMFIVIALTVSFLREKIVKVEKEQIGRLEKMVDEKTKDLMVEKDYVRHLIESSPDLQLTINKECKIMDVNKAFEEIVGKNRKDIIGTSVHTYLPRKEVENFIATIFEKKKAKGIELTLDISEKAMIYNFSATLFTTPEGESGLYMSGRDITEMRGQQKDILEKERQLAHTARLSTLGEMATAMAHEINQPLTIISMAAEGILRDVKKNRIDMSLFPQDIEDILRNVKRVDKIITHMRTFARQPGEWKAVEPEQMLNNAFIIVGEQFRVHGISVSRHCEESLPLIEVDPSQLEQVFINILTNARQILDKKGDEAERLGERLEKQLVCSISREGDWVVYEFADNGYGVSDETKAKIFEPFFTTKEPGEGTGLGLSITYSIVTQSLNGRIWVEDNEMGGASFKVAVPIKSETTKTRRHGE